MEIIKFKESDLDAVFEIQRAAYKPLYDKYHDDNSSPYTENKETVLHKYTRDGTKGYIFVENGVPVGAVRITLYPENKSGRVSALAVHPEHQGRGIAQKALMKIEEMHRDVERWFLDTILQEAGNCYLYEKIGYKRNGESKKISENMTLIFYEKTIGSSGSGMKKKIEELTINLADEEWPFEYTDHDRSIVRAIVVDDDGYFYFVRADRDDDFGKAVIIETSGGGVEGDEELEIAILRELKEELGVEAEIITKLGVVSDYYNLIHRHNINNYYLCRVKSFGEKHMTEDEINCFHLSTLKLTFDEAIKEYEKAKSFRLGRLIAQREMPILLEAQKILQHYNA